MQCVSLLVINCTKNALNFNLAMNLMTNGVGLYKIVKNAFGIYRYLYSELKQADDFLLLFYPQSCNCYPSYSAVPMVY